MKSVADLALEARPTVFVPLAWTPEQLDELALLNEHVIFRFLAAGDSCEKGAAVTVMLPASLSKADVSWFKSLNPGTGTVQIVGDVTAIVPVAEPHRDAANLWVTLLKTLLPAGLTALVPAEWAAWVGGLVRFGVDAVADLFSREPYVERWPLALIEQQAAAIEDPET